MAAETLYDIPLELKPITPFLRRAQELKLKDPTMNYWCTYYAIVQGVHLKPRERDSRNYLIKLMQPLEAVREDRNSNVITENDAACAYIETFALHVFDNADHEDRRGTASRQTARKFLAAANFLELLRVFEEYDSSNSAYSRQQEKIRYAKGKAADIAKAFREGRKPLPGPPLESTSPPPDLTLHPTTSNDPTLESSHQMPPSPESTTHIQTTLVNDVPDSKASSPSPGSSRETPISPKNRNEKLPLSGSGSSFDHGRDALESEIDIDIRAPSSPPGSNVPSLPPDDSYPTGLAIQRGRETVIVKKGGETTHYQLENFLGSGQFGSVYRALDLDTKKVVVIKQIKLESLPQKQVNELIKEVELLRVLSHPKIVKYEAMFREEDTLNLVLEYAEGGSLRQALESLGQLNESLVATYVLEILEGLHYLHEQHVVHRGLRAANIFTQNKNVKLSEFGLSLNTNIFSALQDKVAKTIHWVAPEIIGLKGAGPASDIWSLGCTIVELLTGRPPYSDIGDNLTVIWKILDLDNDCPPLPEGCSEELRDFLRACFRNDPAKRPSAAELLSNHPWLKQNLESRKEMTQGDKVDTVSPVSTSFSTTGSGDLSPPISDGQKQDIKQQSFGTALAPGVSAESLFGATDLSGCWTKLEDIPTATGGNSDIYRAHLNQNSSAAKRTLVAVKVLRSIRIRPDCLPEEVLKKRLMREMKVWSQLNHGNIVPFLGYAFSGTFPCMVAPWYENGSLPDYISRHPNLDKTQMVLESLLGLVHLHSHEPPIVHGDIKASNILVDDEGHARITDFGLSRIIEEGHTGWTTSTGVSGTHRWMAPELMLTERSKPTTAADVYSMTLLALEIYTGKVPFPHLDHVPFFMAIVAKKSPQRSHYSPFDPPEAVWQVFERGWSFDPGQRPSAVDLKSQFEEALTTTGWR